MADRINYKNSEQALQEFLDSCYAISHSTATVNGYKNAITGKTKGFRIFLKERYDCDEIELVVRIKNKDLDVYQILKNYVIFLDKAGLMPNSIKQFFHAVKRYLIYLGMEVYLEKCKQHIKHPLTIVYCGLSLIRKDIDKKYQINNFKTLDSYQVISKKVSVVPEKYRF